MTKAAILLVAVLAGCGGGGTTPYVNPYAGNYAGEYYGTHGDQAPVTGSIATDGAATATFVRPVDNARLTFTGRILQDNTFSGRLVSASFNDAVTGTITDLGSGLRWDFSIPNNGFHLVMAKQ